MTWKWVAVAAFLAALVGIERRAEACAGCSNPNLPAINLTGTTMHVVIPKGVLTSAPYAKSGTSHRSFMISVSG